MLVSAISDTAGGFRHPRLSQAAGNAAWAKLHRQLNKPEGHWSGAKPLDSPLLSLIQLYAPITTLLAPTTTTSVHWASLNIAAADYEMKREYREGRDYHIRQRQRGLLLSIIIYFCPEQSIPSRIQQEDQAAKHALHGGDDEHLVPPSDVLRPSCPLKQVPCDGNTNDSGQGACRITNAPADGKKPKTII